MFAGIRGVCGDAGRAEEEWRQCADHGCGDSAGVAACASAACGFVGYEYSQVWDCIASVCNYIHAIHPGGSGAGPGTLQEAPQTVRCAGRNTAASECKPIRSDVLSGY